MWIKIFVFNKEEKEKEREIGVMLLEKNAALPQRDDRVHTVDISSLKIPGRWARDTVRETVVLT